MRGGHRTCHAFEMGDLEGAPDLLGGVLVARVEARPLLADGRRGALFPTSTFSEQIFLGPGKIKSETPPHRKKIGIFVNPVVSTPKGGDSEKSFCGKKIATCHRRGEAPLNGGLAKVEPQRPGEQDGFL